MELFETKRLVVKSLERKDQENFFELLANPEIIEPIPQLALSKGQMLDKFHENLNLEWHDLHRNTYCCGIFEKGNPEMIGLCLFLTNDEKDRELGYRFRVHSWGKGYGTEITKGMIAYYMNVLNVEKVAADVNIENIGSVKILEKFMNPVKEFFNHERRCTVRRYCVVKPNGFN